MLTVARPGPRPGSERPDRVRTVGGSELSAKLARHGGRQRPGRAGARVSVAGDLFNGLLEKASRFTLRPSAEWSESVTANPANQDSEAAAAARCRAGGDQIPPAVLGSEPGRSAEPSRRALGQLADHAWIGPNGPL